MVCMKTFLPSLFAAEKGDFLPGDFEKTIEDTPLVDCIRDGVVSGFHEMQGVFADGTKSLRLGSSYLHESVFNCIREQISLRMPDFEVQFACNHCGTERLFFLFRDYIFIIRKEGGTTNDTYPSRWIEQQTLDKHVIVLEYTLDPMRTMVQSISLHYKLGKHVVYVKTIPVHAISQDMHLFDEPRSVEVKKPILKVAKRKAE